MKRQISRARPMNEPTHAPTTVETAIESVFTEAELIDGVAEASDEDEVELSVEDMIVGGVNVNESTAGASVARIRLPVTVGEPVATDAPPRPLTLVVRLWRLTCLRLTGMAGRGRIQVAVFTEWVERVTTVRAWACCEQWWKGWATEKNELPNEQYETIQLHTSDAIISR